MDKGHFVTHYLAPLLMASGEDICEVIYEKKDGNETVTVSYLGGGSVECNVSMDSPLALCRDVLKHL